MPTVKAVLTSGLDCPTRLASVFSAAGRPGAPLAMAWSHGAGMACAAVTEASICARVCSASDAAFSATRSRRPGPCRATAVAALLVAQPEISDTHCVGDDAAVRVVVAAGKLVFLVLRIQRQFHALAGKLATQE